MSISRINNLSNRVESAAIIRDDINSRQTDNGRVLSSGSRASLRRRTGEPRLPIPTVIEDHFDRIIESLLTVLLFFSALAFGATEAWSEEVVVGICATCALTLAIKLAVRRNQKFAWSWAYLPMFFFAALVCMQMIVLPAWAIRILSPEALQLRAHLLGRPLSETTVSLYPLATRLQFQLPLCAIAIFVVVLNVYQRREQVIRLLTAIACVGGAVILLAVYQNISGSRTIYGIVQAIHPNSGPFMNYGHFAQFTNIAMGAAIGLLLYQIELQRGTGKLSLTRLKESFGYGSNWWIWLLGGEIVVGTLTVFLSMSRMGALSTIAAGALTAVAILARDRATGRGSVLIILSIIAFAFILYVGSDSIISRLATIRHVDVAAGGRLEIIRDLRPLWAKFPLLGTGLGTHQYVFPMFDRSNITQLATFAENEYAQMLEETGLLGLAIIICSISVILANLVPTLWNPVHRIDAVAFGLLFALTASIIHSFSDFGQHVPAIACLMSAECALVVAIRRSSKLRQAQRSGSDLSTLKDSPTWQTSARWATVLCVLILSAAMLLSADHARAAQALNDGAVAPDPGGAGRKLPNARTASSLAEQLGRAVALEPQNVSFQLNSANQRWELITIRSQTSNADQLRLTDASLEDVRNIVIDLKKAREACPTFGPLYSFTGELEKFVLSDPVGDKDIRTGAELTSYDPNVNFIAGQLDASEQQWDSALSRFRRAIDLDDRYRMRAVDTLVRDHRPDLAVPLVAGRRELLLHLAAVLGNDSQFAALSAQLNSEALALLKAESKDPDAPAASLEELGDEYEIEKNYDAAVDVYRRALNQEYGQVDWRLKLAEALAKANRPDEAAHQARVCLQLRPTFKPAEDLIANLSLRPGNSLDR